jgi:DNA-binding NarL/FixJ family response regulator
VRVILADDAVLFREGTARILTEAGFEVTGQAGDAAELLDLVRRDRPEVAVIDIRMPPARSAEGLDAAVEIRRTCADVGLLLLSQHLETHYAMRLMTEFGRAVGYLLKERVSDLATFASDVRRVANGDCVIDPELVARLVTKRRERDPLDALTEREKTVLGLMAQGRSNIALSAELCLSTKTIEAHVRSIFTKLDLAPDAGDHRRVLAVLAFLRSS